MDDLGRQTAGINAEQAETGCDPCSPEQTVVFNSLIRLREISICIDSPVSDPDVFDGCCVARALLQTVSQLCD